MSDILATLGITEANADPNAYLNQKQVTEQLETAKKDLTSTITSVDLALKTAKLVGFESDATNELGTQLEDTKKMLNDPAMRPDQLEAKRAKLEAQLTAVQDQQKRAMEQNSLKDSTAAVEKVQARRDAIYGDSGTSDALKGKFDALLKRAEGSAALVKKDGVKALTNSDFVPATTLLGELASLNDEKEYEEQKDFSLSRFVKRTMRRMAKTLLYICVVLGGILGGAILSNMYVTEPFWGMKVYYFFYGALAFPITLLMGCVNPPNWYGTIAPIYKRATPDAIGIVDKLFSFTDLGKEEAARLRPLEKQNLRLLSIITTTFLAGLAYYYDVMAYLKQGG